MEAVTNSTQNPTNSNCYSLSHTKVNSINTQHFHLPYHQTSLSSSNTNMANSINMLLIITTFVAIAPLCLCHSTNGGYLYPQFYDRTCPQALHIVKSIVAKAVAKEPRMAASLLRLHFHDCFVKVLTTIYAHKHMNQRNPKPIYQIVDSLISVDITKHISSLIHEYQ